MDIQGIKFDTKALGVGVSIYPQTDFEDINSNINKPLEGKRTGALSFAELPNGTITAVIATGNLEESPWRVVNVESVVLTPTGTKYVRDPHRPALQPAASSLSVPSTFFCPVTHSSKLLDINSSINREPLTRTHLILCYAEDTKELYYSKGDQPLDPWICFNGVPSSSITPTGTLKLTPMTQISPNAVLQEVTFISEADLDNANNLINQNLYSGKRRGAFLVFPTFGVDNLINSLKLGVAAGSEPTSDWYVISTNSNVSLSPLTTNMFQNFTTFLGGTMAFNGLVYTTTSPVYTRGGVVTPPLFVKAGTELEVEVDVLLTGGGTENYGLYAWHLELWDGTNKVNFNLNAAPLGIQKLSKVYTQDSYVQFRLNNAGIGGSTCQFKNPKMTLKVPAPVAP